MLVDGPCRNNLVPLETLPQVLHVPYAHDGASRTAVYRRVQGGLADEVNYSYAGELGAQGGAAGSGGAVRGEGVGGN